jgi:glutamate-5-semialdehyde dehydrogenase
MKQKTRDQAVSAKAASRHVAVADTVIKNKALVAMAEAIERRAGEILVENADDVTEGRKKGLSTAFLDRLLLDEERLRGIVHSLRDIAALPDPVGEVVEGWRTTEGLEIQRVRVPFGVIMVVYEARPNVTVDAAALCLKTGNAVILRGGGDAYRSNRILTEVITGAVLEAGLPAECIQFILDKDREALVELIQARDLIDLVISRGGEELKELLVAHSRIPVIYAAGGNCHVYVDEAADLKQALDIIINAKCQRPDLYNAVGTLLVHDAVAGSLLPATARALHDRKVKLYVDARARELIGATDFKLLRAADKHYATEFLGLELAVRVVTDIDEALEHISQFGTSHSEAIITRDLEAARRFATDVDAAVVYVNASTRFTDGAALGLGAEIGVSTQKLHARGPLGLKELTSIKYVVTGRGHVK